jgi:hypothetical protein
MKYFIEKAKLVSQGKTRRLELLLLSLLLVIN